MVAEFAMLTTNPQPRRWTLDEYYQMGDVGFFNDERVELIDGEIILMPAQSESHAIAVSLVNQFFQRKALNHCSARCRLPLHLDPASEPEPDSSIVTGDPRDYLGKGHPQTALLVVEVADATLMFDRTIKASLYAKSGIQDCWIVNLVDNCVEVHRNPVPEASAKFGFRYSDRSVHIPGQKIKPLFAPIEIAVADILH
jgi:Uma2 family endonuclease